MESIPTNTSVDPIHIVQAASRLTGSGSSAPLQYDISWPGNFLIESNWSESKTFQAETQSSRRIRRYLFDFVGQGLGLRRPLRTPSSSQAGLSPAQATGLPHKERG
jgi:hypothetical protein